jgi:hypothetical protein
MCDGYKRTKQQHDMLLLVSRLSVLGQVYVFIDSVHKCERTYIDSDVL